jgi:hypothetical protein
MKFDDLQFKADPDGLPLIRARTEINGFVLSVLKEPNDPNKYEFVVYNALGEMILIEGIHNNEYDTVIRYQTSDDVELVMKRLEHGIEATGTFYR